MGRGLISLQSLSLPVVSEPLWISDSVLNLTITVTTNLFGLFLLLYSITAWVVKVMRESVPYLECCLSRQMLAGSIIMMAFGWTLFAMTPHENQLVYAAVITSSIPAYTVILYFFYICAYTDCKNWFRTQSVLRCLLGIEMVAGVIEFVGGILFIAASATLNDPNIFGYGVSAGVFGIIAGVTNILSRSCCCAYNCFGFVKDNSRLNE